jgi:pyridoxal phosphate enzyme (YggS family)
MLNAIHAGLADLGENRVQEMVPKMEQVRSMGVLTPKGERPRFHMIGHLQTNKARHVVAAGVDLVHSVDSLDLARELSRRAIAANRVQDILIQVNISGEDTKHGAEPGAVAPLVEAILRDHSGVRIRGYMTMAPFEIEPEQTRPVFAGLRELAARLNAEFGGAPGYEATHLSMGMTNDWRQAVDEGATLVRIGSALFGPR